MGRRYDVIMILLRPLLCMLIIVSGLLPGGIHASAHAELTRAVPAPNSSLTEGPTEIRLTFNERLEKEQFRIRLFDHQGKPIPESETEMSADQRELILKLPAGLEHGSYTVTYHVISSDGHPISDSYVWGLGLANGEQPSAGPAISQQEEGTNYIYLLFRILYYSFFLVLTGWVFWGWVLPLKTGSAATIYRSRLSLLLAFNLLFTTIFLLSQLLIVMEDLSLASMAGVLTGTVAGRSWACSWLLSILGYVLLRGPGPVQAVWVLLVLGVKAFSGHAYALSTYPVLALPLDVLHLAGAAVWAAGVLLISALWGEHRQEILSYLPKISRYALISLVLVAGTGLLLSGQLLQKLEHVPYTAWGRMLLLKVGMTLGVVGVAAWLRKHLRDQAYVKFRSKLRWDISLMLGIVAVAAVFTFYSPVPRNKPLEWSFPMGKLQITPNAPGSNEFTVLLPEELADVRKIGLVLKPEAPSDIAPMEVPLERIDTTHWKASGLYLSLPGAWKIQVRLTDRQADEHVYQRKMRIF
ncbi:copper resistance CopC/CopD family protein [Gorillibacterium sp. sgz5001074]|uniref:copper resistance CopC/CopD family protein n=1 Tax=Gorillibacterium sp. sgz5001074 TaxID=3446695 RepID=UPI003F663D3F